MSARRFDYPIATTALTQHDPVMVDGRQGGVVRVGGEEGVVCLHRQPGSPFRLRGTAVSSSIILFRDSIS